MDQLELVMQYQITPTGKRYLVDPDQFCVGATFHLPEYRQGN